MNNGTISLQDINDEVQSLAKTRPSKKDSAFILRNLLDQVQPIDFKSLAYEGYDYLAKELEKLRKEAPQSGKIPTLEKQLESFKLNHKHYLVITIEQLLKLAHKNSWNLCQNNGSYYVYNGEFWNLIQENELESFLGDIAEKMGVPCFDARHFDFRRKLFKQFTSSSHLSKPEVDKDTVLINMQNGTFEISSEGQRLRDFRPNDFLTYQLPFEYDSRAKAPRFQQYLKEVLPDQDCQQILAEFMGYIFTRNLKLEKILFLYGSGRNGKGVMLEVIRAMLGAENIGFYSLGSLTDENGYYRAKLANKLINWASEIGKKLQSDRFKQLASGEPIEARLPHKDPILIENGCKFVFNSNELPVDVEHTTAFFERFLIIPFNVYIPPEKRDPRLHKKIIKDELPGVFNWVLEGLNRLVRQEEFSSCPASDQVLAEYKKESDSVHLFTDEIGYRPHPNKWKPAKPVYEEYREYCFEEGLQPLARKRFNKRMETLGYFSEKKAEGKVYFITKEQENGNPF